MCLWYTKPVEHLKYTKEYRYAPYGNRTKIYSQMPCLENLDSYPFHLIEQAYLNTDPVLRIRRQDDEYYLTYKGKD